MTRFQDVAEMLAFGMKSARRTFETHGVHIPLFLIEQPKGPPILVPSPWDDEADKVAKIQIVRGLCQKVAATRVMLVVETYMSDKPGITRTDQDPERSEALFFHIQTSTEGEVAAFLKITRDAAGKPTLAPDAELEITKSFDAIWSGMLSAPKLHS